MSASLIEIKRIISENVFTKDIYLDLSDLSLTEVPMEIYEANHIEGFYINGNSLQIFPIRFFDSFPKLKYLDLRFNKLTELPKEIKYLQSLEILLLDGNDLTALPNEIGCLKNLKGLNIGSNSLIQPSTEIVKLGCKSILEFLNVDAKGGLDDQTISDIVNKNNGCYNNVDKEFVPRSAEKLFKPKIYKDIHQSFLDKNRKGFKYKELVTQSDKHNSLVNLFPEPVSLENIERKMIEQMRLAKIKEVKQKKEAELQKTKSKTIVRDWQEEARDLQSLKRRQHAHKMPLDIKLESDDRVLKAPFKVEKHYLEMITAEELDVQKQLTLKDSPKPQPFEKEMLLVLETERRNRQRTIQSDIKKHSEYLINKRNVPKGSAKEELESAKKDMEIAIQLHKELQDNISVT